MRRTLLGRCDPAENLAGDGVAEAVEVELTDHVGYERGVAFPPMLRAGNQVRSEPVTFICVVIDD